MAKVITVERIIDLEDKVQDIVYKIKEEHNLPTERLISIGVALQAYKKMDRGHYWFWKNEGCEHVFDCCFRQIMAYFWG